MNTSIDIVKHHFSQHQFITEMYERNTLGLRNWENIIVDTYFPLKGMVLDIGCGTGREAIALTKRGYQVVGIDISEQEIDIAIMEARKASLDIQYHVCNGVTFEFEENVFDAAIIWAQTFGNLYSKDDQMTMLREIKRVLKDEGILCFSTHDYEFVKAKYGQYTDGEKFYPYADSKCYWKLFTVDELTQLLQDAEFDILFCGRSKELGGAVEVDVLVCVCCLS